MNKTTIKNLCVASVLVFSSTAFAEQATVLNRNFDSDAINPNLGHTTFISGWVKTGTGSIGVEIPTGGADYIDMSDRGQVAFLNEGGRFNQAPPVKVVSGETYTLTFDIGRDFSQSGMDFIARVKANGLALAQLQIDSADVPAGNWVTKSFSFTANTGMPIDKQISIEFQNFASSPGYKAHVDNVHLTTSSSASIIPPSAGVPKTLSIISEDTTLAVPSDYPSITHALSYLDDKYINNGVLVTIQVNDCSSQTYYKSLEIKHMHGERIHIIGDTANPGACVLQFNGVSGIKVSNNKTLGLLNGFHIRGNASGITEGISSSDGASVKLGGSMLVSDFNVGLHASYGGKLYANNALISFNTNAGVLSEFGGFIRADSTESFSNGTHGFVAIDGGEVHAGASKANNNGGSGYYASVSGFIRAINSEASGNVNAGYLASEFSSMNVSNASANNNDQGYHCEYQSYMNATGNTVSGNRVNYSPAKDTLGNWRCSMNF